MVEGAGEGRGLRWAPQRVWEARVCCGSLSALLSWVGRVEAQGHRTGPRPSTGPFSLTSRVVCTGLGAPALTLVNLPNQQSHAALSPWDN